MAVLEIPRLNDDCCLWRVEIFCSICGIEGFLCNEIDFDIKDFVNVFFRSSNLDIATDPDEEEAVGDNKAEDDNELVSFLVDALLNLEMTLILSTTELVTFLKI